jgi:hypothetical protein
MVWKVNFFPNLEENFCRTFSERVLLMPSSGSSSRLPHVSMSDSECRKKRREGSPLKNVRLLSN